MTAYRVKVIAYVVVEATNEKSAKAKAETAVRESVRFAYKEGSPLEHLLADGWFQHYGFQAVGKPEKVGEDE